jgi:hypothetical protein
MNELCKLVLTDEIGWSAGIYDYTPVAKMREWVVCCRFFHLVCCALGVCDVLHPEIGPRES